MVLFECGRIATEQGLCFFKIDSDRLSTMRSSDVRKFYGTTSRAMELGPDALVVVWDFPTGRIRADTDAFACLHSAGMFQKCSHFCYIGIPWDIIHATDS